MLYNMSNRDSSGAEMVFRIRIKHTNYKVWFPYLPWLEGSATYVGVASPSTLRDFLAGFLVVAWPPRRSAGGRT